MGQMAVYLPDGELRLGAFRADSLAAAGVASTSRPCSASAPGWDELTALCKENWTVLAASVLFADRGPRLRDWAAKKGQPLLGAGCAVLAAWCRRRF